MNRNSLYFAANFEPEVARMEKSRAIGDMAKFSFFRSRTLAIIDSVLSASDLSVAGKEEWSTVRSLVEGYTDAESERPLVLAYGIPFSIRFASKR